MAAFGLTPTLVCIYLASWRVFSLLQGNELTDVSTPN